MRRNRRLLLILAAGLVLVVAAYSVLWYQAAERVRQGLDAWAAMRRAEGYTISYVEPAISGFPLRIRLRLDRPVVAGPGNRWRWTADGLEAEAAPWAFRRVTVRPSGDLAADYDTPSGRQTATLGANTARAVLVFNGRGRLAQATADAENLVVTLQQAPGPVTSQLAHLDITLPQGMTAAAAETPAGAAATPLPSAALALRLQDLVLPKAVAGPLGPQLQWLTAEAKLTGTLPPGTPAAALAAWRDGGGTLELTMLDLAWGPLTLDSNATVALDANMQPEGAGTARIGGFAETIDALTAQGLIKPNDGRLAKAALGLIATTPPGGGPKVLKVPLTIQHQTLFAGPIPLMHLPMINWAK